MRGRVRSAALVGATLAGVLAIATPAGAGWASSADAGSLSISSATLAAPTGVAASRGACTRRQRTSLTVNVTWTATGSPQATGYAILRSTSATGPFTVVGTVSGISTTTWTDATGQLRFTTTYYYVVESTVQSWTSPASPSGSVTTPRSGAARRPRRPDDRGFR